jgi:hypothetical protein
MQFIFFMYFSFSLPKVAKEFAKRLIKCHNQAFGRGRKNPRRSKAHPVGHQDKMIRFDLTVSHRGNDRGKLVKKLIAALIMVACSLICEVAGVRETAWGGIWGQA